MCQFYRRLYRTPLGFVPTGFSHRSPFFWRSSGSQAGEIANHKRVDRLYAEAGLQVKKRRRKKIPLAGRRPLERPTAANQVCAMDFVCDRTAEGRSIKSLTVVDDATHEAVAIVPERALGGNQLVRILEQLASTRGLPKAIRTDNGKEFCLSLIHISEPTRPY